MKQIRVTAPVAINTTIQLPASKSISNRALIINALGKGTHTPQNLSDCDDTQVMVRALQAAVGETIDIMAAGTAMRFLTAYLTVTPGSRIITGTERMQNRPIQLLVNALRELGATIEYVKKEGYPPLQITGGSWTKGSICLPGNVSSQYISALLMIGPVLPHGLTVSLEGEVISRPYIDLTLQLMSDFGAQAEWKNSNELFVSPQPYQSVPYFVESDWSAASYWYQIVALAPQEATVVLPALFEKSYQGDSQVAQLFGALGVETIYKNSKESNNHYELAEAKDTREQRESNACSSYVILRKSGEAVKRLEVNFINQPDLAQTFVVTCAMLGISFHFSGLQSLKIKETDRMAALITEMKKLGYVLTESEGSILSWEGERCEMAPDCSIDTYEDHRMAMAFAPASLVLPTLTINEPDVVSKSYPNYWNDLIKAGFNLAKL
ncbi:MAG: 3-phosphoshikimate 1-carboxyvinyltransferase [Phocaeicola sp.]